MIFSFRKEGVFHYLAEGGLLLLGVLSVTFGLKAFLLPNSFIDGGVIGVSLLMTDITKVPLPVLIFLINFPFVILASRQVSKEFALKTFFAVTVLSVALAIIQFPVLTHDKSLTAVFGGFFIGLGIGLSVRGGGVLDGTEVFSLFISKRTSLSIGDVILFLNIILFSSAALILSIETALYSILAYLSASKTIDFVVQGIEEYTGVTIISKHSEAIREAIIEHLGRGVTAYKGTKGFGKHGHTQDVDIIFTVVTRLEVMKLKSIVMSIDDSAFVVQASINDTIGGMVKKRSLKLT
ncbi:MAG: YitT family protein [Bacteroidota bacterium]|nr:YitT family protein [Bacteroidota bacterium]MDP4235962.1 YitT family protein [Bacteroidota bacterium]